MIGALLGAMMVANLIGEVVPIDDGPLQFQVISRNAFSLFYFCPDWEYDGSCTASMMRNGGTWRFICNTKEQRYGIFYVDRFVVGNCPRFVSCREWIRGPRVDNVRSIWEDDVCSSVRIKECPKTVLRADANILQSCPHCTRFDYWECYHRRLCSDTNCWRMTNIFNVEAGFYREKAPIIEEWPLKPWRDLEPGSLFVSHFVELASQYKELVPEYNSADDSCCGYRTGEEDHPSIAFRYPIDERLFGYGSLILVYIMSYLAVWNGYHGRFFRLAIFFAAAGFFAFHGISVLLGLNVLQSYAVHF